MWFMGEHEILNCKVQLSGNAPFKESLQKWMQENNDGNWPKVGIFVMNASLNQRISRVKGGHSPYKLYYGQIPRSGAVFSIGEAARFALSEDGLLAAEQLLEACADAEEVANTEDIVGVI